ncbi:MAG: hypothetical protein WCP53_15240 [Verrucomicrobiota bacterium]
MDADRPAATDAENPPPVPANGPQGTDLIIRIPRASAAEQTAEPQHELPPLNPPTSSLATVESVAITAEAGSPMSTATLPAPPARPTRPGLSLSGATFRAVVSDPASPISAADLFGTTPLAPFTAQVATDRQWPVRLAIALVFGVAGWSAGQWVRSPTLEAWIRPAPRVVAPTADAASRTAGPTVAVPPPEPKPPEARLESVLREARNLISEADWTISARRHLSDAQALHPGDPRILDLSFALEAKLLSGRSPGSATTHP